MAKETERKKTHEIEERPGRYDIFSRRMNRPFNEMERLFNELETSMRRPFGPGRYNILSNWMNTPMSEMENLLDELTTSKGRPFSTSLSDMWRYSRPETRMPMIDVTDKGDHYMLEAELPGCSKEDIELEVTDDNLTVKAEIEEETREEGEDYVRHERGYRSFYRNIPLPDYVVGKNTEATFENGILKIDIPKTEAEKEKKKGKKIKVK